MTPVSSFNSLYMSSQDPMDSISSSDEYAYLETLPNSQFPLAFLTQFADPDTQQAPDMATTMMNAAPQEISTFSKTTAREKIKKCIKEKYENEGLELPRVEKKLISPRPHPQTKKEDPEVIKRRREKNKVAAMKCRRKRKERMSQWRKTITKWEELNNTVIEDIKKLDNEKNNLLFCLTTHECKIPNQLAFAHQNQDFTRNYGSSQECNFNQDEILLIDEILSTRSFTGSETSLLHLNSVTDSQSQHLFDCIEQTIAPYSDCTI